MATYLIYVDFPPMLGPVIILRLLLPFSILQSFAMQFIGSWTSIKGWRELIKVIFPHSGITDGQQ